MRFVLVAMLLWSSTPLLACDFKTGITQTEDGFLYTNDCHREVGRLVKEVEVRKQQKEQYEQLLKVQEQQLALEKQRTANMKEQADLWKNTSKELYERSNKISSLSDSNKWLYLGAGVIITVAAGFALGATGGAAGVILIP